MKRRREFRILEGYATPVLVLGLFLGMRAEARSSGELSVRSRPISAASPAYCNAAHDIGKIGLSVGNAGVIGTGYAVGSTNDCFTGEPLLSCEYPRGSSSGYLWSAGFWIGAIVGEDTLVSIGGDDLAVNLAASRELHPDHSPTGNLRYRSVLDPTRPDFAGAVSEQDYVAVYFDTCSNCRGVQNDPVDDRPHIPLNIKVTQNSYAWSYRETEDLILFDFTLENTGAEILRSLYFGAFVDSDVHSLDGMSSGGHGDDHSGFLESAPNPWLPESCAPVVDIHAAWTADNDGDFRNLGAYPTVPGIFAIHPLDFPGEQAGISFNWWHQETSLVPDFGPQARSSFRMFFGGGLGQPIGDRDKYHVLSNGEIDYEQIRLATIGGTDSVWLPPPADVWPIANGTDTRFVLSLGPFDLAPGETRPIAMALTVGDNFHTSPLGLAYLPQNPEQYLERVDFSDLIENAVIAQYVYDNPGVDTDGDGYAGEYRICDGDTVWHKGDGVPDWRAAASPPSPVFWIEPRRGALKIRWNGLASETGRSWLTREPVFEGYSVYLALDSLAAAFSRIATYDVEDFRQYRWDTLASDWVVYVSRITLESAVCRYAPGGCSDGEWHPTDFTRQAPFVMTGFPDSVFYFDPLGPNAARLGLETPFTKIYPNAPRPAYSTPEQVPLDSLAVYLTQDGYFKYYEYEYDIEDLLAGRTYWLSVTAYDFGSLHTRATPLESSVPLNAQSAVPLYSDVECCLGRLGNIDCDADEEADIADAVALVAFLFIDRTLPCCLAEADINQSGGDDPSPEDITLADIAHMIDHLFISEQPLPECR